MSDRFMRLRTEVDIVTPELSKLLAQFSDEEINTGVIVCGESTEESADRRTEVEAPYDVK